ncbi:pyridoxal kinase PdxY [Corynebacterium striatum]|uniref:pyridoxal kinase PdxY n=1 Tax=Corynebacterium striatum TaxID=43770 RepID=UPI001A1CE74A|nr:pyridoxal kinase PdxY [Corynebacterium striatum]MDK8813129.1 pyridoxal kinase PdxY [Corynebacterium striatum]HAT1151798.1 pyridoxal kinase PdxY [Corynebacterium striatum]HAT1250464.1 pyridoxal kinase PdxY [Corynebacterium striatum]HAT1253147.1 pyridoxal kinase PdxY [Corynebacterium striatum]HAT1266236.1 pyridoxal kinase PdxY [Corynebacterium striatum]
MNILSIQSHVTYGHVGNSAAVFPLQRAGHEVWPVHTVNFSNHTGYGDWGGPLIPAADVTSIIDGIEKRGAFEKIDAILSGYQGGPDIAGAIVDAVTRIKAVNPKALYACDPVMGNAKSGCFVSDEIPPLLRDKVVPVADIITPNQFELGYLTDHEVGTLEQTLEAVKAAQEIGPKTVLVTSVKRPETPEETIEMLAVDGDRAFIVATPFLPFKRNGSGDVTAALFTGHYVETHDVELALKRTASSVYDLLHNTYEADSQELQLIESQDVFANPQMQFYVEEL